MSKATRIRAVFFDIDNTLFPTDEFAAFARKSAIRAMVREGLPCTDAKAYSLLVKVVKKYGPNCPTHFDLVLKELHIKRDPRLIASGVAAYHSAKRSLTPYPDVPGTLRLLRKLGFHTYALSRGVDVKQWDKIILLGLAHLFDGVFVAQMKDARFYARALNSLHLKPSEAVMVGDNPRLDILPAKQAGIAAIHFMKGRHSRDPGGKKADFRIRTMRELIPILRKLRKRPEDA